jgi:hypothetical protein
MKRSRSGRERAEEILRWKAA